jgi:replicative DNA helicase
MLIDDTARSNIIDALTPNHFYYSKNQMIFHTIRSLFYSGAKIDLVVMVEEMRKRFPVEDIKPEEITGLYNTVVSLSAIDLTSHIKRIKDAHLKRELSKIGHTIKQLGEEESDSSIEETLVKAENLVFNIRADKRETNVVSSEELSRLT